MALNWVLPPGGYRFRALRKTDPAQNGWDVFALQTGLFSLVRECDGWFGKKTAKAVKAFQGTNGLTVDGVAGPITQLAIARKFVSSVEKDYKLPTGLLYGAVEHESSFWLGNHSPAREDGSRDNGIVQRNSNYTSAREAYNVPVALAGWAKNAVAKFEQYSANNGYTEAWKLAAGSWNAPAWTDRLAKDESLSPLQAAHINAYISAVTHYAFP